MIVLAPGPAVGIWPGNAASSMSSRLESLAISLIERLTILTGELSVGSVNPWRAPPSSVYVLDCRLNVMTAMTPVKQSLLHMAWRRVSDR